MAETIDYPSEWLDKALALTGKFEGSGFDNISGNFDGMGVSAGILQWCIGQGSLQEKILKPYLARHGSIDKLGIFPKPIMDGIAKASISGGLRQSINEMNTSKGIFKKTYTVKPEWKLAWKKFLTRAEVIEIQKLACESVADQAIKYCKEWDMITPRAFCWFFDLVTQNGSLKGVTKSRPDVLSVTQAINFASPKNSQIWMRRTLNEEQKILLIASHDRAVLSRAAYQKDVMDRKGTIAVGVGVVHGEHFEVIT